MANFNLSPPFQNTTRSVLFGLLFLLTAQALTACLPLAIGIATVTSIDLRLERRTIGRNIDDNTLELKLRQDFRSDEQLGKTVNLSITIINGVVLLTGEVPTDDQRQHAQKVAESYTETRKVVNEVELAGKTTLNSRVNDSYITSKVKLKLLNAENVPFTNIKVITERGKVYLLGLVTPDEAEATVKIVQSVRGIAHIVKVFEYIDP
ncbi:MAG: BON domain-containing protein [Gammaproteobacteria bacterium]|nr:BON domain-containing protein [Gammaproteobacteria bacterium]